MSMMQLRKAPRSSLRSLWKRRLLERAMSGMEFFLRIVVQQIESAIEVDDFVIEAGDLLWIEPLRRHGQQLRPARWRDQRHRSPQRRQIVPPAAIGVPS